jgi:hypothetical protein
MHNIIKNTARSKIGRIWGFSPINWLLMSQNKRILINYSGSGFPPWGIRGFFNPHSLIYGFLPAWNNGMGQGFL